MCRPSAHTDSQGKLVERTLRGLLPPLSKAGAARLFRQFLGQASVDVTRTLLTCWATSDEHCCDPFFLPTPYTRVAFPNKPANNISPHPRRNFSQAQDRNARCLSQVSRSTVGTDRDALDTVIQLAERCHNRVRARVENIHGAVVSLGINRTCNQ
jgi:hypothetical protein